MLSFCAVLFSSYEAYRFPLSGVWGEVPWRPWGTVAEESVSVWKFWFGSGCPPWGIWPKGFIGPKGFPLRGSCQARNQAGQRNQTDSRLTVAEGVAKRSEVMLAFFQVFDCISANHLIRAAQSCLMPLMQLVLRGPPSPQGEGI